MVVLHTSYAGKLSYLAVDSFFVINGLLFSHQEQENFSWSKYFLKRLKVIYLPYFLALTLACAVDFSITQNTNVLIQYLPTLFFMGPYYSRVDCLPSAISLWYISAYLFALMIFSVMLEYLGKRKLDVISIFIFVISFLSIIQDVLRRMEFFF